MNMCAGIVGNAQFGAAPIIPMNVGSNQNHNYVPQHAPSLRYGPQLMPFTPTGYAPQPAFIPQLPQHSFWSTYPQTTRMQYQQQAHDAQQLQAPKRPNSMLKHIESSSTATQDRLETGRDSYQVKDLALRTSPRFEDLERGTEDSGQTYRDQAEQVDHSTQGHGNMSRPVKRKLDAVSLNSLDRMIEEEKTEANKRAKTEGYSNNARTASIATLVRRKQSHSSINHNRYAQKVRSRGARQLDLIPSERRDMSARNGYRDNRQSGSREQYWNVRSEYIAEDGARRSRFVDS